MIFPIEKYWKNSSTNFIFNRLDGMKPISKEEFEEAIDKIYNKIKKKI